MEKENFLAIILGVCLINGIFSPFLLYIIPLHILWFPSWLPQMQPLILYGSSLLLATLTFMISGVPAALLEKAKPAMTSKNLPQYLWLGFAVLISLPAFLTLVKFL